MLKSVSGFEMYRKRHGRIAPDRIVEFLLLDDEFPRAVRYCHRAGGPGSCTPSPARPRRLLLRLGAARRPAALGAGFCAAWTPSSTGGLHEFFDALETKMNTIDECIAGDFFAQRPEGAVREAGQTSVFVAVTSEGRA